MFILCRQSLIDCVDTRDKVRLAELMKVLMVRCSGHKSRISRTWESLFRFLKYTQKVLGYAAYPCKLMFSTDICMCFVHLYGRQLLSQFSFAG